MRIDRGLFLDVNALLLKRPLVIGWPPAYVHGICLEEFMPEQLANSRPS